MARERNLPLYYLATMIPHDEEDEARIRRHLSEREGWGFDTIEQGEHICEALHTKTVSGEDVDSNGSFSARQRNGAFYQTKCSGRTVRLTSTPRKDLPKS